MSERSCHRKSIHNKFEKEISNHEIKRKSRLESDSESSNELSKISRPKIITQWIRKWNNKKTCRKFLLKKRWDRVDCEGLSKNARYYTNQSFLRVDIAEEKVSTVHLKQ